MPKLDPSTPSSGKSRGPPMRRAKAVASSSEEDEDSSEAEEEESVEEANPPVLKRPRSGTPVRPPQAASLPPAKAEGWWTALNTQGRTVAQQMEGLQKLALIEFTVYDEHYQLAGTALGQVSDVAAKQLYLAWSRLTDHCLQPAMYSKSFKTSKNQTFYRPLHIIH